MLITDSRASIVWLLSAACISGLLACGRGSPRDTTAVAPPPDLVRGEPSLVGGSFHVCALDRSSDLWCWGSDARGQTGGHDTRCAGPSQESFGCSLTPRRVATAGKVAQVVASAETTCVLTREREVRCMGVLPPSLVPGTKLEREVEREADDIPSTREYALSRQLVSVPALRGARQIAAGRDSVCGIFEGGAVRCAGNNDFGQLGVGDRATHEGAQNAAGLLDVEQLALSGATACARTRSGELYCWGRNSQGQVGIGSEKPVVERPTRVPGLNQVAQVVVGPSHACARDRDGAVWCFGGNQAFLLAQDQPQDYPLPVLVSGLKAAQLTASVAQTCAMDQAGAVSCWGMALAPGETTPRKKPSAVPGAPEASAVYAASYGVFVSDSGGALFGWGEGGKGTLGSGDTLGKPQAEKLAIPIALRVER